MPPKIVTIDLPLPFRMGRVNCYLIEADPGFALIDTGSAGSRALVEEALVKAGCGRGDLRLVVITHGDFDHTGNAAYLRAAHGAEIIMHQGDAGMVEKGDMFWNRGKGNRVVSGLASALFGFRRAERFEPDAYVDGGFDLAAKGIDARVVHIPGHSAGSIGVLTCDGDLFCGDLLESTREPALNAIIADAEAARASVEKLRQQEIGTVYPGHGRPFPMGALPPNP